MSYLVILGRQPALGLAELESLYCAHAVKPAGGSAALVDHSAGELNPARLGGALKVGTVLSTLPTINWPDIRKHIAEKLPKLLEQMPKGKIKFGMSFYDFSIAPAEINATGLSYKKVMKNTGRSARIIANKEQELNSAQVLHGGLLSQTGVELLIVRDGPKTHIAKTWYVQDIDAYAARDHGRPARDSFVGMLPPKLAQTIINLAVGQVSRSQFVDRGSDEPLSTNNKLQTTILDPFCGTGVVLQEAGLMGYGGYGTDLEPRMIDYTRKNIEWATSHLNFQMTWSADQGDATSTRWSNHYDIVACETYLGRPLTTLPDQETLNKIVNDCTTIHKKFLQNIARQTKPGFRMCIAVPSWKTKNGFKHMPILDSLEEIGYNRLSFVHASATDLIYHREGQVVARELVVLIRK